MRALQKAVLLHLLVQRDAADAQRLGGAGAAVAVLLQRPEDEAALDRVDARLDRDSSFFRKALTENDLQRRTFFHRAPGLLGHVNTPPQGC
jgi:hypothetical protein